MPHTRNDMRIVALVGFLVGWLFILPAESFGLKFTFALGGLSVVGFTLLALAALWILAWLDRFWPHFFEIGKFAAVGTLNSFIDLTILNALIIWTGATTGLLFAVIKWGAFVVAAVNSYFWNKFWTFESRVPITFWESVRFAIYTALGALINAAVAYAIVTYVKVPGALSIHAWDNVAAVIAIFSNMVWNFLTYKKFVFPKEEAKL